MSVSGSTGVDTEIKGVRLNKVVNKCAFLRKVNIFSLFQGYINEVGTKWIV